MMKIDDTITQEKSIFKKTRNQGKIHIKNERKQLTKSSKYTKLPKQKSQQSIKQRSLDEINLRKKQNGYVKDLKQINQLVKNDKNPRKKQKVKNLKKEGKQTHKINSMYKFPKKQLNIKAQKQKKSPKNRQIKNLKQDKPLKITSRTRSPDSIYNIVNSKVAQINKKKQQQTITPFKKLQNNFSSIQLMRTRNITLNEQIFRVFEQTQSKIVQQQNITLQDCEQIQSYYNILCQLSKLSQNRFKYLQQILNLSNSMKKSLKSINIWKWQYLMILLLGLIKEVDQQNMFNLSNILAYVKINYILHIQNILETVKSSNIKIISRIKQFIKKSTKQADRFQKINNNINIIKPIICLILSTTPLDTKILDLIQQNTQQTFIKTFYQIWRNHNLSPYLPPIDSKYQWTLCLDLDQTLIFYSQSNHKLSIRPYVTQFLQKTSQDFQLVIFTSSLKEYADFMVNQIDPKNLISYRLYRENCVIINNKQRKDLTKLGRQISKIFIIDNLQQNYFLQPQCGFTISSWYGDTNDKALLQLLPKLYKAIDTNRNI